MQMLYDSDCFVVVYVDANADEIERITKHNNDLAEQQLRLSSRRTVQFKPVPDKRHCFEIVDKRSDKEVLLTGQWAEYFQRVVNAWQLNTPEQEDVERVLDEICTLAQIPMVIH